MLQSKTSLILMISLIIEQENSYTILEKSLLISLLNLL